MNLLTICVLPLTAHEICDPDISLDWRRIEDASTGEKAITERPFV